MTHFPDLTTYSYGPPGRNLARGSDANVQNVGWLGIETSFEVAPPNPLFVERLWCFCKISVLQTRGLHVCELCNDLGTNSARHNEEELLLGSAEIRVSGIRGLLYAAPNLIYHYVVVHGYSPPGEFVRAVLDGPSPPETSYFELLSARGIDWSDALRPQKGSKPFRFVKTPEGVVKVEVE